MATTKKVEPKAVAEQPKVPESEFTVSEFAKSAKAVFGEGISPDIVTAAFMVNNITSATKTKAKSIVAAFAKKEVK